MKNLKEKGITLVALVITIIVLLILAGVTILALTGENGILTRAQKTIGIQAYTSAVEKAKLAYASVKTEIIKQKVTNSSYDAQEQAEGERLAGLVEKELKGDGWSTPTYNTASKEIEIEYTNSSMRKGMLDGERPKQTGKIVFDIALEKQDVVLYIDNELVATSKDGEEVGNYVAVNWLNADESLYKKTRYKKDVELSDINMEEYQNDTQELLYWQMPDSSEATAEKIYEYVIDANNTGSLVIKPVTRTRVDKVHAVIRCERTNSCGG